MTSESVFKKAELIAKGEIGIPEGLKLPYFLSCSISGPDAGARSIVIGFENHRLKIPVSRDANSLFFLEEEDGYNILRKDAVFIKNVRLIPCRFHAPEQAFIDLNASCDFNCAFCAAPRLGDGKKRIIIDNVLEKVIEAGKAHLINSISLTSGVDRKQSDAIERMVLVVSRLKKELSLPIGVEPYVVKRSEIDALYAAGADEIKINIHSWNRDIFRKVCPQWDYDRTRNMIETACEIFGRGKVTSNIIFGLGENDDDVLDGIEKFAVLGCVPTLRKLRVNQYNKQSLIDAICEIPRVSAQRIISLAEGHKKILEKHKLSPLNFKTMCHACGCCDIVPFRDL